MENLTNGPIREVLHSVVIMDVHMPRNVLYPMHMQCDLSPGLVQMVLILHLHQSYDLCQVILLLILCIHLGSLHTYSILMSIFADCRHCYSQ